MRPNVEHRLFLLKKHCFMFNFFVFLNRSQVPSGIPGDAPLPGTPHRLFASQWAPDAQAGALGLVAVASGLRGLQKKGKRKKGSE